MARYMHNEKDLFRVAIHRTGRNYWGSNDPYDIVNYYGPYTALGSARNVMSREMNEFKDAQEHGSYKDATQEAWIEKASVSWEKVV